MTTNIVTTRLDDWHAPAHVYPLIGYGEPSTLGRTLFGFRCDHCKASWRRDFRTSEEFNTSVGLMREWLEKHRHAPPTGFFATLTQEQQRAVLDKSSEPKCSRCQRVVLAGGCPEGHDDCPQFEGSKT